MNEYGLKDIKSERQLALRGVEVSARITGLLAETSLTQKYKNDAEANLELAYTPAGFGNSTFGHPCCIG